MAVSLSLLAGAGWQFFDDNGNPLSGGLLYTYEAGTATPLATYTDSNGNVANANPIVLDAAGRSANQIWLNPAYSYKFILKTSLGITVWTEDDVPGYGSSADVTFLQAGTGAVARTVQSKLRDVVSVKDFGAVGDGAADDTAAIQAAITAGNAIFPPGSYALTGDISIPSNRKIVISKGATVTNTGGRFTAENVSNVEWQIDGWLKSVAMATAPSKPLWTALPDDRGFIEFAQNYAAGSAASGFWVHGTGKVSADWTGTPNQSSLNPYQVNRKGIACWNAKNVLVEGLEIFGFEGEAVYAACFDAASHNVVFQNNYVHDCRFTALNFNCGNVTGGFVIRNNVVHNCFQIEASVGDISDNDIRDCVGYGIYTGSGAGTGPITIRNNYIFDCGDAANGGGGVYATFASGSPVTGVVIENNTISNSYAYSIYTAYCRNLTIRGNTCIGSGQGLGAYDIGVTNGLRATVSENTFLSPGAFAQPARVVADPANCFDVSVCPYTNVYLPTTGTASPKTGNGVVSIASAAALLLPTIGSVFRVTGTTTITSIAPLLVDSNHDGREITLIFAGALTLTDGSNLKLAGNFVTTADDTITLVGDGTNWYEKSRSAN